MLALLAHLRKQLGPRNFRFWRQGHQVAAGFLVNNAVEVLLRRGPENSENQVELIQIVLPRENGPIGQHLGQNASHCPNVYAFCVA